MEAPARRSWDGRTYYDRPQLKASPFATPLVGTYVFLAGLSGAAQLLATLFDLGCGRPAASTVRRGRFLSLLGPTIGSLCLIADLHTPQRFYNMLRLVKSTSPMSLGSWGLIAFGGASSLTAALQFGADRLRWFGWLRWVARATQVPAALTGGFMAIYTAALFSATSSPSWAAGTKSLAVRFGSASVASASSALSLGERSTRRARDLDGVTVAALAMELAATLASDRAQEQAGIRHRPSTPEIVGIALPLGLFTLSLLLPRRSRHLSAIASAVTLGASLAMRMKVMHEGDASADNPRTSMRFAQPDNLPRTS